MTDWVTHQLFALELVAVIALIGGTYHTIVVNRMRREKAAKRAAGHVGEE